MTMSSSNCSDDINGGFFSQPRGFLTPQPPSWKTNNRSFPATETKPRRSPDRFHVVHKIPSGDSPYVRAKHVQLVDKDPSRAISLFWAAINCGDRVDSALKDMAVVMKQLDRSDEAIEAIKSFRYLSPPESQESLDNILVELYKQSGRIEEEIEMLQRKLKQVEETALAGQRTKTARSQGKKVQITVEKDYSRVLGNLAWAYMQHKDYKSAEDHYRKALSIEADKNKQCNLAVCLMHMNRLTEAKFLLQTVRFSKSGNDCVDEPYAKSYERACEILAEFESGMKPECGDDGMKFSPLPPLPAKANSGSFTEFPYEKRADFGWRRNPPPHCYGNIPRVPLTYPRRGGDHRKGGRSKEAGGYCRKLSFGTFTGNEQMNPNVKYYSQKQVCGIEGDWRKNSCNDCAKVECDLPSDAQHQEKLNLLLQTMTVGGKTSKSWADMVEEDELENVDSNIIQETPNAEKLGEKMEHFGSGYLTQPEKTARRSLCFDHDDNNPPNLDGGGGGDLSEDLSFRRRRLKVFQDITPGA